MVARELTPTQVSISMRADLIRSDLVKGLVWFVNYAAIDPSCVTVRDLDLNGTAMLPEDVEKFAHRWLAFSRSVDINHDGIGRPVSVIESFYNSADVGSPAFPINSHPARFDISRSKEAMEGMQKGTLNSVSLDALTFNRVIKVAVAKNAAPTQAWVAPKNLSEWAFELAQDGWQGVTGIKEVSQGLFVALRGTQGMPVAVQVHPDGFEASGVASGPWASLAATVFTSPTLHGSSLLKSTVMSIDHRTWSQDEIVQMMHLVGVPIEGNLQQVGPVEQEVFAVIDTCCMQGYLPHHTVQQGRLALSRDGVVKALANIDTVPEALRAAARAHLQAHLAEMGNR